MQQIMYQLLKLHVTYGIISLDKKGHMPTPNFNRERMCNPTMYLKRELEIFNESAEWTTTVFFYVKCFVNTQAFFPIEKMETNLFKSKVEPFC